MLVSQSRTSSMLTGIVAVGQVYRQSSIGLGHGDVGLSWMYFIFCIASPPASPLSTIPSTGHFAQSFPAAFSSGTSRTSPGFAAPRGRSCESSLVGMPPRRPRSLPTSRRGSWRGTAAGKLEEWGTPAA
ncbi:uncharacterized protein LOC119745322 [Patiria miniata]|uniref:Uncharacterized protein n=1 Tax=Patiria miniata TaxID=46514 RepID=A0A914BPW4_PATMI|nr:uncharacterized protein LOC119745322 [Patiria miniata]